MKLGGGGERIEPVVVVLLTFDCLLSFLGRSLVSSLCPLCLALGCAFAFV